MAKNTFTRIGSIGGSTFDCRICGRKTRHTGEQALGIGLCPPCYNIAGIENSITDSPDDEKMATMKIYGEELKADFKKLRSKGVEPSFDFMDLYNEWLGKPAEVKKPEAKKPEAKKGKQVKQMWRKRYAVLSVSTRTFRVIVTEGDPQEVLEYKRLDTFSTFGAAVVEAKRLQAKEDAAHPGIQAKK